jgi:hypothetical protein
VYDPAVAGLNETVNVSEAPAATVAGRVRPVTLNAVLPVLIVEMVASALPVFLITSVWVLLVPAVILPNESDDVLACSVAVRGPNDAFAGLANVPNVARSTTSTKVFFFIKSLVSYRNATSHSPQSHISGTKICVRDSVVFLKQRRLAQQCKHTSPVQLERTKLPWESRGRVGVKPIPTTRERD